MGSPSFTPSSTAHTNKHVHNKEKEIKVLLLSSNKRKLRYGGRNNIFEGFLDSIRQNNIGNGVVEFGGNWRIFGA